MDRIHIDAQAEESVTDYLDRFGPRSLDIAGCSPELY